MEKITVSPYGAIENWYILGSIRPILFSSQETGQAGSIACAPLFGKTPESVAWLLPEHGTVQSISAHHGGRHLQFRTIGPGDTNWKYHFAFAATTEFPWAYHVEVTIQYNRFKRRLTQTLQVTRSLRCENEDDMPTSFGFRSNFSTNNEPFRVRHDGKVVVDETHPLGSTKFVAGTGASAYFVTEHYSIFMECLGSFEGYAMVMESPGGVTIGPVGGVRKPFLLPRGKAVSGTCHYNLK